MKLFRFFFAGALASTGWIAAQTPVSFAGTNVTGQLVFSRTVNLLQTTQLRVFSLSAVPGTEALPAIPQQRLRPRFTGFRALAVADTPRVQSLPLAPASGLIGFDGLTQRDQRLANNGNQLSVEPPNPAIAVANGYILAGVNNAVQVYSEAGTPLLPRVLSSNELFGLPPSLNRTTGAYGAFPTDMRVFFDQSIQRWFVVQQAQDRDQAGNSLASSHIYVAVSQTADPLGIYLIYIMDTTDAVRPGCPCLADYPQIGADQYGFYISSNEFATSTRTIVGAQIHAVSKASLSAGAQAPTTYRFVLPYRDFEFAVQPATTPPDASYFLANGGMEYFVSTDASFSSNNRMAVWAMSNTSSLATPTPAPVLTRIAVSTTGYEFPDPATQRSGFLPYGSTLSPPGQLAYLDSGDSRTQSVVYAGGRLYTTFSTAVIDETGRRAVGGGYVIFSPTSRSATTLSASVVRQGYVAVKSDHILYPAVAVNAQGRGAIAFTVVGPDYYPSAGFVALDTFSTGTAIQLARSGAAPEDGFTGYPGGFGVGTARWGDYSTAVGASNGAVWMVTEYIPNLPRTEGANWGTYVVRFTP